MLALTRKAGESLEIICGCGETILVVVNQVTHDSRKVRIGVKARPTVKVWRSEISPSNRGERSGDE